MRRNIMRYIVPVRDEMKCSAKVLRLRKKKNTVCDRIVTIGLYAFSYIYIYTLWTRSLCTVIHHIMQYGWSANTVDDSVL